MLTSIERTIKGRTAIILLNILKNNVVGHKMTGALGYVRCDWEFIGLRDLK